ncbi:Gfo/Idh/MocA family protein [Skermania piniformis]|uniref:Gfo/Idh/MocA family oxidoreductase n=1 Tax=Skermania pinensis TaxID=39122 RepID=A0ABX8SAH3_9ACTN|nr:Gfo/Idh/MocA family oxidoreductase [Skermania piniformis]QXQ13984.1 Gfo/Idh/MocA family oxidoreductase [Skermania piniformis]
MDVSRPVGWGIIGAGRIAATVAADIARQPDSRLVAIGARDRRRADRFAADHGVERAYGSYAELLADPDVDVVHLATTHGQHHPQALQIIAAGKAVLIEKAFTLNAIQAAEVAGAARAAGVFCMEAMWLRVNPLIRRARELVDRGAIGDLVGVRADLSKRFPYDPAGRLFDLALGGGALLDLGGYTASFAWEFLGRPDTVTATGALAPTGSDLTVATQWGYSDGRVAQLYCSAAADSPAGGLIYGTAGWIEVGPRIHHPAHLTVHTAAGTQTIPAPPESGNGYGPELDEVVRCLRAGLPESPLIPLDDTVGILDTLDRARAQLGVRYPGEG